MKTIATLLFAFGAVVSFAQSKNQDYHLNKEYKIDAKGTLTLSCSDAKVFITGSSRKTAQVKIDREVNTKGMVFGQEEFRIDIDDSNGNLEIKEHSNSTNIGIVGYHYEKYTINIELPEGASLRINGDDGDYRIESVNGAMDVQLDDGDLDLIACKGNDFKFRIDDGDIRMDEGSGTLEVDADDADIEIQKGNFSAINADLDDGDFIVQTSLSDTGNYFIDSQDGLVALTILGGGGKFDIRHDDGHVSTQGNFSVVEKSEDRTRLTLASGNAKVDIRADDARVRLATN
jgi:hypothetical protein